MSASRRQTRALVAAKKNGDLHLTQAILVAERMHHQRLLHARDGPAYPVDLQHSGLAGPKAYLQNPNRKFGIPELPGGPRAA